MAWNYRRSLKSYNFMSILINQQIKVVISVNF